MSSAAYTPLSLLQLNEAIRVLDNAEELARAAPVKDIFFLVSDTLAMIRVSLLLVIR